MLNKERFFIMIEEAARIIERVGEWRYGQAVFNLAYDTFPEEANLLRGTQDDCFYDDDKVEAFLANLETMIGVGR